jgi:hypothetical protein
MLVLSGQHRHSGLTTSRELLDANAANVRESRERGLLKSLMDVAFALFAPVRVFRVK